MPLFAYRGENRASRIAIAASTEPITQRWIFLHLLAVARDAAELIKIEYGELPVVTREKLDVLRTLPGSELVGLTFETFFPDWRAE